jgi:ubiquinone/menaquinone biosynthesis C-methylase UbiE
MNQKFSIPAIRKNLECGFDSNNISSGREPCQMGWYEFVCEKILKLSNNQSNLILDVGCGMHEGVNQMRSLLPNDKVIGQDIDHKLSYLDSEIIISDIKDIRDKSFDFLTCFDVIEHVENDMEFFNEMKRICRKYLFITTPNFTRSRAQNHCHCREYTIPQFINYFSPDELWVASPDGFLNRSQILQKKKNTSLYIDLTRASTIYNQLDENISFKHSTVDGEEWPHYMGIFKL